ncbi:MAG: hypothetical protein EOO69_08235 [Moraxellaceae bacterium]|nr:MAG: hypothetical protein EOO69_08235 [Moraxellaceae bacterium]
MLNQHVLCFEHETLYPTGCVLKPADGLREIPQALFDELFYAGLDAGNDKPQQQPQVWFVREWLGRQPVLKTRQYVGVVQGRCGHVLEILPKTGKAGHDASEMRLMLLHMLHALPDMPFKTLPQPALVQLAKMPLLQVFIQQALSSIANVIQHGLKQQYQSTQDNQPMLRGRLLISQQVRYNHSNQAHFYSEHDEYVANCAENRILRLALTIISRFPHAATYQHLVHACIQHMAHIPVSRQPEQDFKSIQLDRNNQYYASALQWAKLVITDFSPSVGLGQQTALSLLFDMNKLFESIVACQLKRQLPIGWQLKTQQQTAALVQVNQQPQRKLQPDLLLFDQQQAVALLDCKWKLKSGRTFSQLNPDEQELYQMFAYAAAYLPKGGNVCLIYPKTPQFSRAVEQAVFHHIRDVEVHLWLLPFCLQRFELVDAPFQWSSITVKLD